MALDAACPGSAGSSHAAVRAQATSVVQQRGAQMCGTPGSTALFALFADAVQNVSGLGSPFTGLSASIRELQPVKCGL